MRHPLPGLTEQAGRLELDVGEDGLPGHLAIELHHQTLRSADPSSPDAALKRKRADDSIDGMSSSSPANRSDEYRSVKRRRTWPVRMSVDQVLSATCTRR